MKDFECMCVYVYKNERGQQRVREGEQRREAYSIGKLILTTESEINKMY